MAKYEKQINGKAVWVITEPVARMLPDQSGYQEDGFIASFGLEGEIGNYIRNGKPHVLFNTEPEAATAAFAELEKLLNLQPYEPGTMP
jgi:hypothetical protein